MNDLIELKLVTEDEAEFLHRLQVEAFIRMVLRSWMKNIITD